MKRLLGVYLFALCHCAGDAFHAADPADPPPVDAAADVVALGEAAAVEASGESTPSVDAAADAPGLAERPTDGSVEADAPTTYELCQESYLRTCAADPSACSTLTLVQVCGDGGS